MDQQQTAFENIVGKERLAHNEQFLFFPRCFLPNQIIVPNLTIFLTSYFYLLLNWKSPKLAYEIKEHFTACTVFFFVCVCFLQKISFMFLQEAVQKAQTELENQIERMGQDRLQLENRNRELEHRIYNYLEREKKMMEDNQHQIDTAGELNASLRKQLDDKSNEIREINDKFNKEVRLYFLF